MGNPPKFLRVNKTASPNKIEPTDKGLKLTRAANVTKGNEVLSLQWNGLIQGDFEVTADYRDYASTTTGTDWKVPRIELTSYLSAAGAKDHTYVAATYHERTAAREAIPGLRELIVSLNEQCDNGEFPKGELNDRRVNAVKDAIKSIEAATTQPELRNIAPVQPRP